MLLQMVLLFSLDTDRMKDFRPFLSAKGSKEVFTGLGTLFLLHVVGIDYFISYFDYTHCIIPYKHISFGCYATSSNNPIVR